LCANILRIRTNFAESIKKKNSDAGCSKLFPFSQENADIFHAESWKQTEYQRSTGPKRRRTGTVMKFLILISSFLTHTALKKRAPAKTASKGPIRLKRKAASSK
jgi:hypothetical protein